ncbi:MAG TPA: RnfABCDGE type electron transport complex subunit B [Gammaproteobacteria bacterium]|nr:RnfABCDGE type electron transport complex subunit B [Gammaproteobacteria bacterium]
MPTKDQVEALLPQTQCQRCEYTGCSPYAEAVANEGAPINKCAPGGAFVLEKLAGIQGRKPTQKEIDGLESERMWKAYIDPNRCIGCYKCVDVCPTAAIVGHNKSLHGVLEDLCTGCGLCLPTCPMDCIEERDSHETLEGRWERKNIFQKAYEEKQQRQTKKKNELKKTQTKLRQKKSTREETLAARQALFQQWVSSE